MSFRSVFSLFSLAPFDMSAAQPAAGGLTYVPSDIGNRPAPQISTGIPAANAVINPILPDVTAHTTPLAELQTVAAVLWLAGMIALAILYGLALQEYFCICLRIGKNRSFCQENAKGLHRIFQFFLSAALLWLAAEFSAFLPGMAWGIWNIAFLLLAMASAAMGILAYALGKLLKRATQLQEENELTI